MAEVTKSLNTILSFLQVRSVKDLILSIKNKILKPSIFKILIEWIASIILYWFIFLILKSIQALYYLNLIKQNNPNYNFLSALLDFLKNWISLPFFPFSGILAIYQTLQDSINQAQQIYGKTDFDNVIDFLYNYGGYINLGELLLIIYLNYKL